MNQYSNPFLNLTPFKLILSFHRETGKGTAKRFLFIGFFCFQTYTISALKNTVDPSSISSTSWRLPPWTGKVTVKGLGSRVTWIYRQLPDSRADAPIVSLDLSPSDPLSAVRKEMRALYKVTIVLAPWIHHVMVD